MERKQLLAAALAANAPARLKKDAIRGLGQGQLMTLLLRLYERLLRAELRPPGGDYGSEALSTRQSVQLGREMLELYLEDRALSKWARLAAVDLDPVELPVEPLQVSVLVGLGHFSVLLAADAPRAERRVRTILDQASPSLAASTGSPSKRIDMAEAVGAEAGFGEAASASEGPVDWTTLPMSAGGADEAVVFTGGDDPAAAAAVESRWLNARIEGHAPGDAIPPGASFVLAVGVDVDRAIDAVAADRFVASFPDNVEEIELAVVLHSDDFEQRVENATLRVPRTGASTRNARFVLTPKHAGVCTALVFVFVQGNYVQQLKVTVAVGDVRPVPVSWEATGRPLAAATSLGMRHVSLCILPAPGDGYTCIAAGSVHAQGRIGLTQAHLAAAIQVARNAIMKVINSRDAAGVQTFQTSVRIEDVAQRDAAVRVLAEAGYLLFQQIFFGPGSDAQTQVIGNWLLQQASDRTRTLNLQVVARDFPLPWAMLYLTEAWDPDAIDWHRFLGMRHVIEQIPAQTHLSTTGEVIGHAGVSLPIGLCLNEAIDEQMKARHVELQQQYWEEVGARLSLPVACTRRVGKADFIAALRSPDTIDQILYLYCHAETAGLAVLGGPGASWLALAGDERVTLNELRLNAPETARMHGEPLVFINACESAELSPAFYDGFVPYFMAKGARGVIGTECKTPAGFAVDWSMAFFDRFLAGKPLGEVVLELRRKYYEENNNPLGLMYAIHCDGDTVVARAAA